MLKIFNTLTKKKEKFFPITSGEVKLYVCGITAYDLCHIGHGRTFIIFDTIIRYFQHCGYQVKYVRNITDIDDKIINKAVYNHETTMQLTNRMIQEMHLDLDMLNILRPNYEPKVTEYIDAIIQTIYILIKKNHAYIASNGDVVFAINTIKDYGILSNRKINFLKKNQSSFTEKNSDFVLWKMSKLGEPCWKSPWGLGRPGWHIECSAMSYTILGNHLDIHGGGLDLLFPHHENETIQSICAYGPPHVNFWMHSGMLSVDNKKMSKSLNNFFTIRDIIENYHPETLRYFLMSSHYRKRLQYTEDSLKKAQASLTHLYIALRNTNPTIKPSGGQHFISKFIAKMNDDFNIPAAYAVLFEIAHTLNNLKSKNHPLTQGTAATLKYLANIIGLLYQNPESFLIGKKIKDNVFIQNIESLIYFRENARKNKQWELADKMRNKLMIMGVILEDTSNGKTKWRFIS